MLEGMRAVPNAVGHTDGLFDSVVYRGTYHFLTYVDLGTKISGRRSCNDCFTTQDVPVLPGNPVQRGGTGGVCDSFIVSYPPAHTVNIFDRRIEALLQHLFVIGASGDD